MKAKLPPAFEVRIVQYLDVVAASEMFVFWWVFGGLGGRHWVSDEEVLAVCCACA